MMIVAGTVVRKMVPIITTLYEQMPDPKYVVAMGGCAISGGPYVYDSYTIVRGVEEIVPGGRLHPRLSSASRGAAPRAHEAAGAHPRARA